MYVYSCYCGSSGSSGAIIISVVDVVILGE
jgi:hypothetical protein